MRYAILSDIHGNLLALQAVLDDIVAQGGVDGYWVLGDFSALGYDPVGVLEQVNALPNASFTRGNTDRYIFARERPRPSPTEAQQDAEALARLTETEASFFWTQGYVQGKGWYNWLANLPLEVRMTLPDGTRVLGVHAAPGRDDGPGINPGLTEDELRNLLVPAQADLVFTGHTHFPCELTVDGIRAFNLGSISNPVIPSLQATYALLEADNNGHHVQRCSVEYDRQAVIEALDQVHYPGADYVKQYMRGEIRSHWA
jgi:predicted phosphodiesterase